MKQLNAVRFLEAVGGKALVIPKEGWRAHTFRIHGRAMLMAMHRAALITQKKHTAICARETARAFRAQIELAVVRFLNTPIYFGPAAKAFTGDSFLDSHARLFEEVLNDVLLETGEKITREVIPSVQSTLAQGYSKTSILLGQKVNLAGNPNLQRRARELAGRITGISETTRKRFRTVLKKAVASGWSVSQTTNAIREKLPKIQGARALTIARTELNAAWREGSIQAFKESSTITLISVLGCESREEERWDQPSYQPYLYRGESTCNIQDVPVADADKLEFHINHTGTIVPSGFID